jgi:hypothetical protein
MLEFDASIFCGDARIVPTHDHKVRPSSQTAEPILASAFRSRGAAKSRKRRILSGI